MKSVTKLIRRFVGILMLSTILLFLVNLTIFLIIGSKQAANSGPWTISSQISRRTFSNRKWNRPVAGNDRAFERRTSVGYVY